MYVLFRRRPNETKSRHLKHLRETTDCEGVTFQTSALGIGIGKGKGKGKGKGEGKGKGNFHPTTGHEGPEVE